MEEEIPEWKIPSGEKTGWEKIGHHIVVAGDQCSEKYLVATVAMNWNQFR